MKIFLFSRRFWIPLILALVVHVSYLTWDFWRIYKDDFVGKAIPKTYLNQWLVAQAGMFVSYCFLPSFLVAIVYYSHCQFRKRKATYKPFSIASWAGVIVMGLATFLYNEYGTPRMYLKSRSLLTDFIYSKPGEKFIRTSKEVEEEIKFFNVKTATLPELYHARDSIAIDRSVKKNGGFVPLGTIPVSMEKRINLEIGLRWNSTLGVIIFYVLGILLSATFYRTYAFIPILVGWLGLYYLSQAGKLLLETMYKQRKLGQFFGSYGMTILLGLIGVAWYLILHQKGLFRNIAGQIEENEDEAKGDLFKE
jgi:hypothetical protein